MNNDHSITELLISWNEGDDASLERLLPIVEQELRRIAHNFMRRENANHTLQTTALVNEAYLKLVDQTRAGWQNRAHFFAIASQLMRRILINHARDRVAEKRGRGAQHVNIDELDESQAFSSSLSVEKSRDLLALDEALEKLEAFDKLKSRIVELRYFGGLTIEETSEILQIAPPTVSLHWRLARAWLQNFIRGDEDAGRPAGAPGADQTAKNAGRKKRTD